MAGLIHHIMNAGLKRAQRLKTRESREDSDGKKRNRYGSDKLKVR